MEVFKYWSIGDFEISSYKWGISKRKNKTYYTSGSDNTGKCKYTYNELGFRGDSISKSGFKIMSVGCSITEGVGVNNDQTWSHFFSRNFSNGVNLNFGCGGRSNDYISRCLLTYFDHIKPDLVLIMYTSPSRREIYTKEGNIEPYMPTSSWGWLKETDEGRNTQEIISHVQNKNEDVINWYKNHLLIKYFLESKKCNWVWNGHFNIPLEYTEPNRFDGNYNNYLDKGADGIHPGPIHNFEYSRNLYKFIIKEHPNFLSEKQE